LTIAGWLGSGSNWRGSITGSTRKGELAMTQQVELENADGIDEAMANVFPPEDDEFEPTPPQYQTTLYDYCATLPEAPALVWTRFYDADGFQWTITLRAGLPDEMATKALAQLREQMDLFAKGAKHYHWSPNAKGATKPQRTNGGPPAPAPAASSPPAPATTRQDDQSVVDEGISTLHAIKVDADGVVLFYVEGFRWPFKDHRGAETVARMFPGDWQPDHFNPGAKWEGIDMQCHWEKVAKGNKQYYNVVRVE
jgi:hypothetical protein